MPFMLPAAAATTAIGTGAAVGAGIGAAGALGTGIAAGSALAGGAGLAGLMGGMGALGGAGTAGSVLGGAALTPAVASLAPAATAQAMGPTLLQASLPGIQGGAGALSPGAFGANLTGASQGLASALPGAANQTLAQQIAQQQAVTNATRQNLLAQSGGTDIMGAATQKAATSPYDLSAGFKQGLQPNALQMPSLTNPTASPLSTAQAANPADIVGRSIRPDQNFMQNLGNISSFQDVKDYADQHPYATSAMAGLGAMGISKMMEPKKVQTPESNAMIRPYTYERTQNPEAYAVSPTMDSSERMYFNDQYVAGAPYKATEKAEGGIAAAYAVGGPVEQMSAMNAIGANTGYPMANINSPMYSNPMMQRPEATNVIAPSVDAGVGAYSGEPRFAEGGEAKTEGGYQYSYDPQTMQFTQLSVPTIAPSRGVLNAAMGMIPGSGVAPAPQPVKNSGSKLSGGIATPAMGPMQSQQATPINVPAYQSPEQQLGLEGFYDMMNQRLAGYGGYGGFAAGGGVGGEPSLGGYSDGGRLLKGPGDGVSDSIPASIGNRQPARLADGEFVVPARIVSELGNGSTEAGARKLYAMMDRVQKSRKKSVGKGKVAVDSKASKHLPA
jgi:hypothetical protein